MTVSVCIPTYNRIKHFSEALKSCLSQTLLPNEILIGDDSNNEDTEKFVDSLDQPSGISVRYFKNQPSLKQAKNINMLFSKVTTDLTVLLHDDDMLLPYSMEKLHDCFIDHPETDIAFGKQLIISEDGEIDQQLSDKVNSCFYRTPEYTGSKISSLEAGFVQQFPNDGYMLRSSIFKKIKYKEDIGDACDFEFGLQLGLSNYNMHFLNNYTAKYRLSKNSVATKKDNNAAITSFRLVQQLKVPQQSLGLRSKWLQLKAPVAMMQACRLNQRKEALEIYFSKWHRSKILSLGGMKRLLFLVRSNFR